MSRSLNRICLIGNTGSDPEVRTTGSGTKVAEFSVATTRKWKDASGQQQEKTDWHKIIAWKGAADLCEQYVKKGDRLYVEGAVEYRTYDDKNGNTKYVTEINAKEIILLGGKNPAPRVVNAGARAKPAETYEDFPQDDDRDSLPF